MEARELPGLFSGTCLLVKFKFHKGMYRHFPEPNNESVRQSNQIDIEMQ